MLGSLGRVANSIGAAGGEIEAIEVIKKSHEGNGLRKFGSPPAPGVGRCPMGVWRVQSGRLVSHEDTTVRWSMCGRFMAAAFKPQTGQMR